ncbi:helix-turn-helix domain-containing protein [Calidithermus timidus]|uniref:helix-turn-helix domain-containing protein n=1 Tax=Calidithermus timidus TaxID=307124 RepID=UPI00039B34D2|nr:helix-turn-helix domain-containing protein [Calidithermus timidus]
MEKLALSAREAARLIGAHEQSVYKWVRAGKIPHKRIGRKIVFPVQALQRWLEENSNN